MRARGGRGRGAKRERHNYLLAGWRFKSVKFAFCGRNRRRRCDRATMKPQPVYTFKQFNEEINDFHKYLKDNRFGDEDIGKIFAPLHPVDLKPNKKLSILLISLTFLTLLYLSTYIDTISWHFSALGRILLIKLLPLWDWTPLKNSKCLIPKPTSPTLAEEVRFSCELCETVDEIDVYDAIGEDLLKNRYLDVDVPVIVRKTFAKSDSFIADLIDNPTLAASRPCRLATNVANDVANVKSLLLRTEIFDSFFLHFQNCELPAMKQFRGAAPRPRFLPATLSPVQYNWLLWSRDYNVSAFKTIGLVERVAVVGQVFGGNLLRLVPRRNCAQACPKIEVRLREGESLVLTSLWDLEYKPDVGENVAVILEMH